MKFVIPAMFVTTFSLMGGFLIASDYLWLGLAFALYGNTTGYSIFLEYEDA